MGGGSSRQRSRRRVTFKDEEDDRDEESYDHHHHDKDPNGHHREESTTSLGQRIIQRARNDRTPPPSQPTQRQQRGPVVILIRDPKTGQIRRATSFAESTENKTVKPENAKPPTPPPQETVDRRRKHRPNKPVMSFDLWGDPVLGPDVESIAPPASTTSGSVTGGSFMARKEYDRQLAMKIHKQNQRKELQSSVSESDVRSTSTQRVTPVELYPAIRHRRLGEDFENDSETIGTASQIGVEHNQSLLRKPGGQAQHPSSRDGDSRKKPPYEILSERKRKKKIPKSDQVSYQQLSHGFSSTSEQFSQNVSRKTIPSKDDSPIQEIQTY